MDTNSYFHVIHVCLFQSHVCIVKSLHDDWYIMAFAFYGMMLGLHRTPEGLVTDLRPKKVACTSYVTHQKVINYSWIVAITRSYSPLKSASSTTAFNRQKRSWNLSISLASELADVPSSGRKSLQVGRNSLDGLVCHSARSSIGRKSLLKFLSHANFCRTAQVTRGGRAQVVGRSLIGRKASRVSWRSIASVSRRSGRGCGSGARVYADRLTNGVRGSRARKPRGAVASHSYHLANHTLLLLVCQSLPHIDVNARLRSDDQSLTTAHESKKSGILQLVNRS